MTLGQVRDKFPRVTLSLPGRSGPVSVEFVVDTGFDGELALLASVVAQLNVANTSRRPVLLADGSLRVRPYHEILLRWDGEPRLTEVLELEGNPLLGVDLMAGKLLQAEMAEGGEVLLDPL